MLTLIYIYYCLLTYNMFSSFGRNIYGAHVMEHLNRIYIKLFAKTFGIIGIWIKFRFVYSWHIFSYFN